jgi:hypothetical protein
MDGVEASLRIRVQDFRARYPPFEEGTKSLPPFAGALTAACEYLIPQSIDALPKGAQLSDIPGHRVVLVVAVNDLPKPCTDIARAIMHPAAKLYLDSLELRNHPLLRRNAPDGERIGLVASPLQHVGLSQRTADNRLTGGYSLRNVPARMNPAVCGHGRTRSSGGSRSFWASLRLPGQDDNLLYKKGV